MPAKSKAQFRLMAAAEHNPAFARKVGIKPSVGKEFVQATPSYKALPEKTMKHEAKESPAYEKAEESLMKKHHPKMYEKTHGKESHSDHGHKHLSHKMMPGEHRKEERLKHYNQGFSEAVKARHRG